MLEIGFPTLEEFKLNEDNIREVLHNRVLPGLEKALNKSVPPDLHLRIEKLEIDLGQLSPANWEEELAGKIEAEVMRYFGEYLPPVALYEQAGIPEHLRGNENLPEGDNKTLGPGSLSGQVNKTGSNTPGWNEAEYNTAFSQHTVESRREEALVYFLRFGILPWFMQPTEMPDPADVLRRTDLKETPSLIVAMREVMHEPAFIQRFARYASPAQFEVLVRHSDPVQGSFWADAAIQTENAAEFHPLLPITGEAMRMRVRSIVLAAASDTILSQSSSQTRIQHFFRQLMPREVWDEKQMILHLTEWITALPSTVSLPEEIRQWIETAGINLRQAEQETKEAEERTMLRQESNEHTVDTRETTGERETPGTELLSSETALLPSSESLSPEALHQTPEKEIEEEEEEFFLFKGQKEVEVSLFRLEDADTSHLFPETSVEDTESISALSPETKDQPSDPEAILHPEDTRADEEKKVIYASPPGTETSKPRKDADAPEAEAEVNRKSAALSPNDLPGLKTPAEKEAGTSLPPDSLKAEDAPLAEIAETKEKLPPLTGDSPENTEARSLPAEEEAIASPPESKRPARVKMSGPEWNKLSVAEKMAIWKEQMQLPPEPEEIERTRYYMPQPPPGEGYYIGDSGLVIAWPYFKPLFTKLGYVEGKEFVSIELQYRAVHLLHYMATGNPEPVSEIHLVLGKVLCGFHPDAVVPGGIELTAAEREEADGLLQAVIDNWAALKKTSITGLRNTFLLRKGKLERKESDWMLSVEKAPLDILMERLPWGIGVVRLPWRKDMILVEW